MSIRAKRYSTVQRITASVAIAMQDFMNSHNCNFIVRIKGVEIGCFLCLGPWLFLESGEIVDYRLDLVYIRKGFAA